MANFKLFSDNQGRPDDFLEVQIYKNRHSFSYNTETEKHDLDNGPIPDVAIIWINEWHQVELEKDKVIFLINELKKLL